MKYFKSFNESLNNYIDLGEFAKILDQHLISKQPLYITSKIGIGVISFIETYIASRDFKLLQFHINAFQGFKKSDKIVLNALNSVKGEDDKKVMLFDLSSTSSDTLTYLRHEVETHKNILFIFKDSNLKLEYIHNPLIDRCKSYTILSDDDVWKKSNKLSDFNDHINVFGDD